MKLALDLHRSTTSSHLARACRLVTGVAFLLVIVLLPGVAGAQSLVADFNADGRPDVAVAKRLGNHGGSSFRIDLQLSNGRRQSVSFASAQSALRVAAVDVDNDHDIDLVVMPLLGQHVIGVWLNDGAGNFAKGRTHDYVPFTASLSPQAISGLTPQFALATSSSRRLTGRVPSRARAPAATIAFRATSTPSTDLPSRFLAASLSPRAPPLLTM